MSDTLTIKEEITIPTTDEVVKENPNEPVHKRIYVGGLHSSITEEQINDRFLKFGEVEKVTVAKDVENQCRGFAHMTIHTTPKQWEACLSVYNGARWKGQYLKLEEAKIDYQERKRLRQEKILEQEEKKKKRILRWNDSEGFHAKDMTPVTDNNMGSRKGWKRGRYGRAIATMRHKKNDGTTFVFDPVMYKNNLTKLYNIGVRMKPVNKLITKVDDESSDDDRDDWPSFTNQERLTQYSDEEDNDRQNNTIEMTGDQKRRAAMEKMFEDQKVKNEMVSKSLAEQTNGSRINHTTFENNDEKDNKTDGTSNDMEIENVQEPIPAKKWMFDSDEEDESDEELAIKINPVLEGEAGRKRLELQKKFKGDERFKLGEDFIDEEEKNINKKEMGDDITKELGAEKDQAMDVLRSMFGDSKVDTKAPSTRNTTWSNSARFDPDADDADQYLANKTEESSFTANKGSEDEEDDLLDLPRKPESAVPVVSTEKHFEVNTNLKPLFGDAKEAPFTLFGGDNHEPVQNKSLFSVKPDNDYDSNFTPKKTEGRLGLGVLFFFHLDEPTLMKKSCYSYDPEGIFQEKADEKDSYETKWRTQRPIIKEVLKKLQRNATRNQKKRTTQNLR